MVVEFTTTYSISAYHWCHEIESRSERGVQHYVIKFVSFIEADLFFWASHPWTKLFYTKEWLRTVSGLNKLWIGGIYHYLKAHTHKFSMHRISIRTRCTTLCDKVCQWLATGRWFSPGPPVSSTNKTDRHDITVYLVIKAGTMWPLFKVKDWYC
jgi:hypothetical protein